MSKQDLIRERFEEALVDGLKGPPIIDKETGEITKDADGSVVRVAPEASFLSVVRAYLKDLLEPKTPARPLPKTGEATGLLKNYGSGGALPFGNRTQ